MRERRVLFCVASGLVVFGATGCGDHTAEEPEAATETAVEADSCPLRDRAFLSP
jgi:hypothetical protein